MAEFWHYPFSAIEGQADLQRALLLAAIDPKLGGVLIEGPRGTAKTTAARALADLLTPAPFVSVPLGCVLDRLVGSLDIGKALADQQVAFAPGLLAQADGGVLYVDEINLLPDALVDVLLDVAASGVNRVERDGISHHHAASFVLIGTMNPQEGALRPQLLDRLGLCVEVQNVSDLAQRQRIVRSRLAFDRDPQSFVQNHAAAQAKLGLRLRRARELLPTLSVDVDDAVLGNIAHRCVCNAVDGMRADIVLLRASQALAAWEAADNNAVRDVTIHHVDSVAELVLRHRRGVNPAQSPAPKNPDVPRDKPMPDHMNGVGQPPGSSPASSDSWSESAGDWGGMPPEAVPTASADNPSLQQWMQALERAVANPDEPKNL